MKTWNFELDRIVELRPSFAGLGSRANLTNTDQKCQLIGCFNLWCFPLTNVCTYSEWSVLLYGQEVHTRLKCCVRLKSTSVIDGYSLLFQYTIGAPWVWPFVLSVKKNESIWSFEDEWMVDGGWLTYWSLRDWSENVFLLEASAVLSVVETCWSPWKKLVESALRVQNQVLY